MTDIKRRRLQEIEVSCHPGTHVGDYVPFYFCLRSVMLYIFYQSNHPSVTYRGGQRPIVHLQADLRGAIAWGKRNHVRGNPGSYLADFFGDLDGLNKVNWQGVAAIYWSDLILKEGKQAEFLMHDRFPWELIERIGVFDAPRQGQAEQAISGADHRPLVTVESGWYY